MSMTVRGTGLAGEFLDAIGHDLGRRRSTVEAALQWVFDHRPDGPVEVVETGIYSGVGAYHSTRIFGRLCQRLGGRVRSVDIDPRRVHAACELLEDLAEWVEPVAGDSVTWLKGLDGPIHLLHLDSWDYNGGRINRWRSRRHGLREIKAACPRLAPDAVVLIDDQNMGKAWWRGANYALDERGKGARAVPWLLRLGWRVLAEDYQIALVRSDVSSVGRSGS